MKCETNNKAAKIFLCFHTVRNNYHYVSITDAALTLESALTKSNI